MSASGREPDPRLALLRAQWAAQPHGGVGGLAPASSGTAHAGAEPPLWVFGYASLIWRPEFDAAEHRPAAVHGWHRALRMRSQVNRGTPQQPGLVFALMPGGACRGFVYRVRPGHAEAELQRVWDREMVGGGLYDPRFLPCRTPQGEVRALAFTLSRHSPHHTGRLGDEQLLQILREARGRYGTTLDYLADTARALRERGVRDREIERLMRLAVRAGLVAPDPAPGPARAQPTARHRGARSESRSASVSTSTSTPGSSTATPSAG